MLHEHDLTWLVKLVIWPWSLSTCRLKSSFSSFIRSLSLLSFLKSSSKIFTWSAKKERAAEGKSTRNCRSVCKCSVYLTCSLSTAIWVSSSCFLKLLAASAKLPWPGGCWEDEGECRFKASSKAWIRQKSMLTWQKRPCARLLFLHLFHTHSVEALDLLLLVLSLFAEGHQLILQVADLLLQLGRLSV